MIPKEKAEELVLKFMGPDTRQYEESGWAGISSGTAKQCALIAVNELIEEIERWHKTSSYEEAIEFIASENRVKYWKEVKEEIKNLKY